MKAAKDVAKKAVLFLMVLVLTLGVAPNLGRDVLRWRGVGTVRAQEFTRFYEAEVPDGYGDAHDDTEDYETEDCETEVYEAEYVDDAETEEIGESDDSDKAEDAENVGDYGRVEDANSDEPAIFDFGIVPSNVGNMLFGTEGDDYILVSGSQNYYVFGFGGNDVIRVTNGRNNTIDPGAGNNRIYGGWGTDTYVIGRGYGTNIITAGAHTNATSGTMRDRLIFRDDITPDDVYFARVGDNLEIVVVDNGTNSMFTSAFFDPSNTNRIVLVDFYRFVQRRLVSITFPDGTVMTDAEIFNRGLILYGTEGDDEIIVSGSNGHYVFGLGGNDIIRVINGRNNTIDPGMGNNRIYGGSGTDTYVIGRGYGTNIITAGTHTNATLGALRDRLIFHDDITLDDVYFARVGNNLEIIIVDNGTSGRFTNTFFDPSNTNRIVLVDFYRLTQRRLATITFPDGTVMTDAEIFNRGLILYGTEGDDEIRVSGGNGHYVFGFGGNDTIRAINGGNNTIDPGMGNNRIYGSWGTDIYIIGRGYGTNIITAGDHTNATSGTMRDRLIFRDDIRPDDVYFARVGDNLEIIVVDNGTSSMFTNTFFDPGNTNRIVLVDFYRLLQRRLTSITFPCGIVMTSNEIFNRGLIIYGTEGDDEIRVSGGNGHYVFGFGGNDTIRVINGGNNTIDPGMGNNRIYGSWGTDTYIIGRGYGTNIITAGDHTNATSGTMRDRLIFRDDIRPDDVYFARVGDNLEIIVVDNGTSSMFTNTFFDPSNTNRIVLVDFYRLPQRRLASITFPCGTVMTSNEIFNRGLIIYGTEGDDEIRVSGGNGHYVFGLGGNDIIRVINGGNNTIDPGMGNNRIYGGWGTDTYVIGRGYGTNIITAGDHINATSGTMRDRLIFRDGITPEELSFTREGYNQIITVTSDPANIIILIDYYRLRQRRIAQITFCDKPSMPGGNSTTPSTTAPLLWPTPSMEVTLWYGQLDHISQVASSSLNIQGAPGDPVYAIASGIVANIQGNRVYVNFRLNGRYMQAVYGNLVPDSGLRVGGRVTQGQPIGRMGMHMGRGVLEVELRESINGGQPVQANGGNGRALNPAPLFDLSNMPSGFLQYEMSNFFARNAGAGAFGRSMPAPTRDIRFAQNLDLGEGEVYLRRLVEYIFHSNNMAAAGLTMDDVLQWCSAERTVTVTLFGTTHVFMPPEVYAARGVLAPFGGAAAGNVQYHAFERLANDRTVVLGAVLVLLEGGEQYYLPEDVEWYLYVCAETNMRMYTSAERIARLGSFTDVYVGILRDMNGGGRIGEVFAQAADEWTYVGRLMFEAAGIGARGFAAFASEDVHTVDISGLEGAREVDSPDEAEPVGRFAAFWQDGNAAVRTVRNVFQFYIGVQQGQWDVISELPVFALFGMYHDEFVRLLENPVRNLPQILLFVYGAPFVYKYLVIRYFIGMGQDLWSIFRDENITMADVRNAAWAGFAGDDIAFLVENFERFGNFHNLTAAEARELGHVVGRLLVRAKQLGLAAYSISVLVKAVVNKVVMTIQIAQAFLKGTSAAVGQASVVQMAGGNIMVVRVVVAQGGRLHYAYMFRFFNVHSQGAGVVPSSVVVPSGTVINAPGIGAITITGGTTITNPAVLTPDAMNVLAATLAARGTVVQVAPAVAGGLHTLVVVTDTVVGTPHLPPGIGFDSRAELIAHLGNAGYHMAWHHIVEESQIIRSGFTAQQIHNTNNVVAIPSGYSGSIHGKISGHFSSKPTELGGLTVREWLAGQSFEVQFQYGLNRLQRYGIVEQTQNGWTFTPFLD